MVSSCLLIFVWAKLTCIFRYSFCASSGVTAGVFFCLLVGWGQEGDAKMGGRLVVNAGWTGVDGVRTEGEEDSSLIGDG